MSGQATLGNSTPDLDADTLREYLGEKKWSVKEVADKFAVSEKDVKRAISAHDIDYNPYSAGAKASGSSKMLWEMDADDLGGGSA